MPVQAAGAPAHRRTAARAFALRALRVLATAALASMTLLACSATEGPPAASAPPSTPPASQPQAATAAPSPVPVPTPVTSTPAPLPQFTAVTVRPGDTLWSLARDHHTTVAALQQANHLGTSDLIRAGKQLWIPAPPRGRGAAQQASGMCVDHAGADGFAIGVCTHVLNATQVQPDIYLNTVGNTSGCSIEIEVWSEDGYGKLSDLLSHDCTTTHQVGTTYTCDPAHGGGETVHADAYLRTSHGGFRVGQGKTVHLTCTTP